MVTGTLRLLWPALWAQVPLEASPAQLRAVASDDGYFLKCERQVAWMLVVYPGVARGNGDHGAPRGRIVAAASLRATIMLPQ